MFALVDCNNFYASCQRVFEPHLQGKPIAVLSNNDGCVIARSEEAKAVGIPMGAPAFEYEKLFKEKGVYVYSSNYALYGDMSNRVMNLLSNYSPEMEVYSIDEAFLKFSGFDFFDLNTIGLDMQKKVTKGTGIPISVGIAPTKTLAKMANKIAKKFADRTKNVYLIDTDEKRIKALKWTKIEAVWGIGRKHAKRLQAKNIKTAYDFIQLPDAWVRREMSVVGLRLKHELEGKPSLDLEIPSDKKAIAITRSFEKRYTTFDEISERISTFTVSCAEKLRHQKSHCTLVTVFIQTNFLRKDLPQNSRSITITTDFPTSSTIELNQAAQKGFKAIFEEGFYYKKAGVIVSGITPNNELQLNLFEFSNPKHQPLMQTIDKMNASYGENKIRFGMQDLGRQWKMKQEKLSPKYSTKFSDIMTIRV